MNNKENKGNHELSGIITELQGILLRDAPQSPAEKAREQQRLDEINAILDAKEVQLSLHIRRMLNEIEGKQ